MSRVVYENEVFEASPAMETFLRRLLGRRLERAEKGVRIARVAGHVRAPGGDSLIIRSRKAGGASLLSWIAYGDPELRSLQALGRLPEQAGESDIGSLVARMFCLETWRAIQTTGLLRTYQRQRVDSAVIRGRIDFARMARSGGDLSRTPCIVFARLPHTPLNRLLSAAISQVRRDPELRAAAGPTLAPLGALFAEVPPLVDANTLAGKAPPSRLELPFASSAALARLILRAGGLAGGSTASSLSFLIDLASLFESSVARAFHDSHLESEAKRPVNLLRENARGLRRSHSAPMELDVFLPDVQGERVIVDAKYKRGISAGNLQQMAAYCWLTGARLAVLVCPSGQVSDRRSYLLPAGDDKTSVIRVEVVELDLDARSLAEWHQSARNLVSAVETIVSTSKPS